MIDVMYEGIVTGVDGSRCASDAALWAAEDARLRVTSSGVV
ncbi:hypothetical protein [Actinomadura soli]|nr:hypothetical protein [Actinomadura soli]